MEVAGWCLCTVEVVTVWQGKSGWGKRWVAGLCLCFVSLYPPIISAQDAYHFATAQYLDGHKKKMLFA